jgi:aminoglycoside/choline kinase family phosphotransferase
VSESQPDRAIEAAIREVARSKLGAKVRRIERLRGALGSRSFSKIWIEMAENAADSTPETLIVRVDAKEDASRRPAGIEPEPALEPIRALLESKGLPVPRRFAADPARGIELLEDLGELSLQDYARTASESDLHSIYVEACALPPRLQQIEACDSVPNFQRSLDCAHFRYKADRFARWTIGGDAGASPAETQVVREAFDRIQRTIAEAPQRLAHRDLQSANLHVVDPSQTTGIDRPEQLVMIDLQGALLAPPEYDLVCLLRDSYVELGDDVVEAHLARTRTALPDCPDQESFRLRFDLLTLTRKGKDYALFRAVASERGDDRYLQYLPATRRYLQNAADRVASKLSKYSDLNDLVQAIPETP